jgi:hypothetical protein
MACAARHSWNPENGINAQKASVVLCSAAMNAAAASSSRIACQQQFVLALPAINHQKSQEQRVVWNLIIALKQNARGSDVVNIFPLFMPAGRK